MGHRFGLVGQWLPLAAGLALLFGCEEEPASVYDTAPNNGRVLGSVTGRVLDGNTGALLSGATIAYADYGGLHTTSSNEQGYFVISGLYTGDYILTASSGTGYATMGLTVEIPALEDIGIVDIPTEDDFHYNTARDIMLYPLTSTASGVVYKQIENGELVAGAQIPVVLDFSAHGISPSLYSGLTGETGVFQFTNLPAVPTAVLRIHPYNDGVHQFDQTQQNIALAAGAEVQLGAILIGTLQDVPFVVSDNISAGLHDIHEVITLDFNKPMVPAEFEAGLQGQDAVELNSVTWSQGNRRVTIQPDEDLHLDQAYDLTLVGRAADNSDFASVMHFRTQAGIEVDYSNLQAYDGYYAIGPDTDISIRFTEAINAADTRNVININGQEASDYFFASGNLLTIIAPANGYQGASITLGITVYSNLAEYDFVTLNRTIVISD